ncbi:MAG: cysteine--tRNA ligase [Endomicrobium sp.]|jgi:cysteinyl-tRNA synthetase|nr:cysteine--tRNA ligase [Endomicrobium sp.]
MIKIYNSISGKKEIFKSQRKNHVSMYVCGLTPYDDMHLGHARAYVAFDIIKRHLLKRGYKVKHVQNFTDVDDKIIERAMQKKISPLKFAQFYIDDFFDKIEKLNILKAEIYPRVTQMIPDIINFIKKLIDKGFAYETNGNVYFSVEKIQNYCRLSKKKLNDLRTGTRMLVGNDKKSIFDFVLWKKTNENEPQEVTWTNPWNKRGRPGWHIECSVMSLKLLGDIIDIHGGGQDLIFPHHENEIAQSEAMTGKQFVKYWIHNGFVTINKKKMSKSLNNFFTLESIFKKYSPRVVRYYLLTQHYSVPLEFSIKELESAKNALQDIDYAYLKLASYTKKVTTKKVVDGDLLELNANFLEALDNDFNSVVALAYFHKLKNMVLSKVFSTTNVIRLAQIRKLFEDFFGLSLGFLLPRIYEKSEKNLDNLLKARVRARKQKDWLESDRLRMLIRKMGYKIFDNKDGSFVIINEN